MPANSIPAAGSSILLQRRLDVATRAASPRKTVEEEADDANLETAAEVVRLEQLAAALPAGAVERFTRKVQPLLVNNCTTSGCHQAGGKQVYQLDRAVLHGLSNRRTTLSNLAATLALVNRDAPQQSLLLTVPRTEHADMKQPILGSRQDQQFRQLAEWVCRGDWYAAACRTISQMEPKPRRTLRADEPRQHSGATKRFRARRHASSHDLPR